MCSRHRTPHLFLIAILLFCFAVKKKELKELLCAMLSESVVFAELGGLAGRSFWCKSVRNGINSVFV